MSLTVEAVLENDKAEPITCKAGVYLGNPGYVKPVLKFILDYRSHIVPARMIKDRNRPDGAGFM